MDKLRVGVDFDRLEQDGKRILVFDVAGRLLGLPVQVDGIAWWREGDRLVPMPEDVHRRIYAETGFDFSGSVCEGATIKDLDEGAINAFRSKWAEKSGNNRIKNLTTEQLLVDCEAISDGGVTYAALVVFGTRAALGKYLPRSEIVFEQVLPSHSRNQIKVLMRELHQADLIYVVGKTSAARWYAR
jgi:ATP-dependent DNA helicase RecG